MPGPDEDHVAAEGSPPARSAGPGRFAVRTMFFGSGAFAMPALERLLDPGIAEVVAVVTAPPRPKGRKGRLTPTPVAALAAERSVPVLTPTRLADASTLAALDGLQAGLLVLADYGRLVPPAVLEMPLHGALNIHPSLLPRHRGAAPVPAAILAGDEETGVTLMRMDAGLDTGPIIAQRRQRLRGDELAPDLERSLAEQGASLLMETLPGWLDGTIRARPQPHEGMTLTRPLRRSDGELDPSRPAEELERQVRAYQPWPGSFIETDGGRLIIWRAEVADGGEVGDDGDDGGVADGSRPGELVEDGEDLALLTAHGRLRLLEVQPAGRTRMSAAGYRRGRRT